MLTLACIWRAVDLVLRNLMNYDNSHIEDDAVYFVM
jgi:hypothetical protein